MLNKEERSDVGGQEQLLLSAIPGGFNTTEDQVLAGSATEPSCVKHQRCLAC